ncbi:MAG: YicC/YloC family endoribonuclease [Bacteroidales bacterium]|nr:YicC/YloC family endoribonuclease [Bacteroidales bacterium]
MVQSMTGYGKAECICGQDKIIIEIRSVNGKGADISLKTQIIPREKEIEIRQIITKELSRGNIDLFASIESAPTSNSRSVNRDLFNSYFDQIETLFAARGQKGDPSQIASAILKLPDIFDSNKKEVDETLQAESWEKIKEAISEAVKQLKMFRTEEGRKLEEEIRSRVDFILDHLKGAEFYEAERIDSVKERLKSKIEEFIPASDNNRFEQELIYYLEKLDITEEKVRLRQHCKYFIDTLGAEEYPGKKLGFIAQEMGREINTLGSKANHSQIQMLVVQMKDELEKIKEQTLNLV